MLSLLLQDSIGQSKPHNQAANRECRVPLAPNEIAWQGCGYREGVKNWGHHISLSHLASAHSVQFIPHVEKRKFSGVLNVHPGAFKTIVCKDFFNLIFSRDHF